MIQSKRHITDSTTRHWSLLEPKNNFGSRMDQALCTNAEKRETHCFVE